MALAAFAGLRLGVAAGLQVGDVDYLRRVLLVRRQVQRAPGGAVEVRHFYASGLIAAGCDVVTVQRALGHAKATTTLNTYAHVWPTAEDRTRRAAGNLLAGVLPIPADRGRTNQGP